MLECMACEALRHALQGFHAFKRCCTWRHCCASRALLSCMVNVLLHHYAPEGATVSLCAGKYISLAFSLVHLSRLEFNRSSINRLGAVKSSHAWKGFDASMTFDALTLQRFSRTVPVPTSLCNATSDATSVKAVKATRDHSSILP